MADAVKKSRIVSDDENLEEAFLEEFNLRLKNCMSQDDLQKETEPPEPDDIYENINSPKKVILDTNNFLQTEIEENHYEVPKGTRLKNGTKENGHKSEEEIYESIPEKTDTNLDQNYIPMVENKNEIDLSPQKSEEYEPMGLEEVRSNLYESVELAKTEQPPKKATPTLNLPTTCFTDYSEDMSPDKEGKCSVTARDRMLLSCDDTSTLLFTQTVTSPMLTPSEENIDFLKGFQRDNTISESTATNSSPPKDLEEKLEASETSPDVSENLEEEKTAAAENFYENTDFYNNTTPENMYENVNMEANAASNVEEEAIYEQLELKNKTPEEQEEGNIYQNIEEALAEDVIQKNRKSQDTDEGSLEEFIRYEKEVSESFLVNKERFEEDIEEEINDVEGENIQEFDNQEVIDPPVEQETISTTEKTIAEPLQNGQQESMESIQTSLDSVSESKEKIFSETYKELIYHQKSESNSNYYEKYTEVLTKKSKTNDLMTNREKDTETVPAEIVKNLKSQFQSKADGAEVVGIVRKVTNTTAAEIKSANIINQIKTKFEGATDSGGGKTTVVDGDTTEYSETIVETNAPGEKCIKKKKVKKTRKEEKENISVKSSFSKFDALQKKNVLHVRSSDSTKAQEKFSNGSQIELSTNCKSCGKQVFQMEQIKAERSLWHKNCFRCTECSKQLTVDTYESNDGSLYCKPHFKALFAPKAVEEDASPKPRRPELIIRENQPQELPPDVVRASDKPDLGLEELQSLNVKERFQVFEHYQQQTETNEMEKGALNVKRSPSILSKLARFQKHGMDIGVSNEALDGIPIEESESEEEEDDVPDGEDADLVRAKKVQKEKPFHFTGMSDVKKRWEQGDNAREERREETKQEIQNIRTRLFMGKQEKMKEAYQQAVMESESSSNLRKNISEKIEACDTKSIKERFEKGENVNEKTDKENRNEEEEVYESEISKKSRSLFLELDASASKAPQLSPVTPPKLEVKKAREAYLEKASKEDTVKSTETVEEVEVKTADIQERFKFFETYKEPEKHKKQFRITPPRDPSQVKTETPDREIYRDPDVIRADEEFVDDSKVAQESHTASKMLNKFRQMEENLTREPEIQGPKPLKCFTPPPEPSKPETQSEEEESSEYEEEEEETEEVDNSGKLPQDLIEAQKAARAKQLRAKFEKWEANEIKKEQNSINITEEYGEEQSQIESTRVLRARFEQMRGSSTETAKSARVKPNRFV
ncbi:unnamed protein product [Ceutorhynchus assimilis]|uniref:LIM zinc-binding domain-containing protein n=1 Tax=Ceutorhynchus assimilis TaxID=467358 RepID=A0A9P0DM54_9CUCU|nr:unnamed protein product [Ceutorhynchus assimilis]